MITDQKEATVKSSTIETVDQLFKLLNTGYSTNKSNSSNNTSSSIKSQSLFLESLLESDTLHSRYLHQSPLCQEIFSFIDETEQSLAAFDDDPKRKHQQPLSLGIQETQADLQLACLEKSISFYNRFLKQDTLMDVNRNEMRTNLNTLLLSLLESSAFQVVKRGLNAKSNTPKSHSLQITCLRLLTFAILHSKDQAVKLATEFHYYSEYKHFLQRFLLQKKSELRDNAVQFLCAYFKHAKSDSSTSGDIEYAKVLKKIFLNYTDAEMNTKTKKFKSDSASSPSNLTSPLLHCLFIHLSSDSRETIELLLDELLFKCIQNEAVFSKSDKVRIFNERTLSNLVKLFEWEPVRDQQEINHEEQENEILNVREMCSEFLKTLFASTRYGISFYIANNAAINSNHLIFNALLSIQRPSLKKQQKQSSSRAAGSERVRQRTCQLIDQLLLKTLKVCPDLIQRFLKVKQRQHQEEEKVNTEVFATNEQDDWFLRFTTSLFHQQLNLIRQMRLGLFSASFSASNALFLRSLISSTPVENFTLALVELIVYTSLPACISFAKLITQYRQQKQLEHRLDQTMQLLIVCLKCIREWVLLVRNFIDTQQTINNDENNSNYKRKYVTAAELNDSDRLKQSITICLGKALTATDAHFFAEFNLELLTKYLPPLDLVFDLNGNDSDTSQFNDNYFTIFTLYFEALVTTMTNNNEEVDESSTDAFFNLLHIDLFEKHLFNRITNVISAEKFNSEICLKYLCFSYSYTMLKRQKEFALMNECDELDLSSSDVFNRNATNLISILERVCFNQDQFELLVDEILNLIELYANVEYVINGDDISAEKFNRELLYVWLLELKQRLAKKKEDESSRRLLVNYATGCLSILFSARQRRLLMLELSEEYEVVDFSELFTFICLKYMQIEEKEEIMELLISFLFNSRLLFTLKVNEANDLQSLTNQCFKVAQQTSSIDHLRSRLESRINECVKEAKIKRVSLAEVLREIIEKLTAQSTDNCSVQIAYLNLGIRARHELLLLLLILNKSKQLNSSIDLDRSLNNLVDCINLSVKLRERSEIAALKCLKEKQKSLKEDDEITRTNDEEEKDLAQNSHLLATTYCNRLLLLILNNNLIINNWLQEDDENNKNDCLTQFLINSVKCLKQNRSTTEETTIDLYFESYLIKFISKIDTFKSSTSIIEFICMLRLKSRLNELIKFLLQHSNNQQLLISLISANRAYLTQNNDDISKNSLLYACLKFLLTYLSSAENKSNSEVIANDLIEFALSAYKIKPALFVQLVTEALANEKLNKKQLKRFFKQDETLKKVFEQIIDGSEINSEQLKSTQAKKLLFTSETSQEVLLNEYSYSMSDKDQLILKLMFKIDSTLNCIEFKQATNEVEKEKDHLSKQVKIVDFINEKLNQQMLVFTIRNFPIHRKLDELNTVEQKQLTNKNSLSDEKFSSKVYDPIYLLPNFYNLLNYANIVDVFYFVQQNCLSYLFVSLSSDCARLRSLAYASIYRFYMHLENNKSFLKKIISYLINLLRNSLTIENQRLASIVSVFLAESVKIIVEPGTPLYKPLVSFLLLKPTLDLANVPEFYKLFNSSALQYKIERRWMLQLLGYGCRTSLDYRLYEKRFVYRQLLSIYTSSISDAEVKSLVLSVLLKTAECKYALIDLIRRHYFLVWLTNALTTLKSQQNNANLFQLLLRVFILIWKQLGRNEKISQEDSEVMSTATLGEASADTPTALPFVFLSQMFILMKILLVKLEFYLKALLEFKFELAESEINLIVASPEDEIGKQLVQNFVQVVRELLHILKQNQPQTNKINIMNITISETDLNETKEVLNRLENIDSNFQNK